MRIISGIYKNKSLISPHTEQTHPMSERARSAIFNHIGDDIKDSTVLDAFSGTGALGLEAASRGASQIIFLENHKKTYTSLIENINSVKNTNSYDKNQTLTPLKQDFFTFIPDNNTCFNFIFIDPPYLLFAKHPDLLKKTLRNLKNHYNQNTLFILSHPASFSLSTPPEENITPSENRTNAQNISNTKNTLNNSSIPITPKITIKKQLHHSAAHITFFTVS